MWKKLQRIEIDIEWYLISNVCKVIKPTHMNLSCLKLYLDLIVFLYLIFSCCTFLFNFSVFLHFCGRGIPLKLICSIIYSFHL